VVEFARVLRLIAGVGLDIAVPAASHTIIGGARSRSSCAVQLIEKSSWDFLGRRE
jgi:hypothetical protein